MIADDWVLNNKWHAKIGAFDKDRITKGEKLNTREEEKYTWNTQRSANTQGFKLIFKINYASQLTSVGKNITSFLILLAVLRRIREHFKYQ